MCPACLVQDGLRREPPIDAVDAAAPDDGPGPDDDNDDAATTATSVLPVPDDGENDAEAAATRDAPAASRAPSTTTAFVREDALRRDEVGRIAVFARLTLLLCVAGLVLSPFYGGDPIAWRVLVVALLVAAAASTFIEWMTRRPRRYDRRRLLAAVQLQELCATAAAYFFGVFSPFPAVVALGIYVYSLGANAGDARASYLNLALGQALLGGAIIAGVVVDRGMVHAEYLDVIEQVMVQGNVQFVYLLAYLLGRLSRRKTVAAIAELEGAVRAIAQRDALFEEARQELDRVAHIGGSGRFSHQQLGPYRLGVLIGRGAMGEIYRAEHVETGAAAAVKVLQRRAYGDVSRVARFAREARIAASFTTPYVVRILDVGEEPVPYIAMELLEGDDLARVLRDRRALTLDDTVQLVREVATGLAAAHAAGIVHRDIKPQNLFRAEHPDGARWKILDFGISKLAGDTGTLTGGALVGTPAYMAPEQAAGAHVDRRTDLHALAAVAYRCVTGHPAFSGPDPHAAIYAVIHRLPVRPGELAALPPDLDAFFAIALAKTPGDRFTDAATLAHAFAQAARSELGLPLRDRAARLLALRPWHHAR